MKAEVKRAWLERLRSGKVEQTTGQFADIDDNGVVNADGPHCVLGVLANVLGHNPRRYWNRAVLSVTMRKKAGIKCESPEVILTPQVMKMLTDSNDPAVKRYIEDLKRYQTWKEGTTIELLGMNDSRVPFSILADIIDLQFSED
jgi:hypothetical protein